MTLSCIRSSSEESQNGDGSLGEKEGGPLNPEEINDLVAFVRNWEKTAPTLPEEALTKESRCLPKKRWLMSARSCIGCHENLNPKHIDAGRNRRWPEGFFPHQ